MQIVSKIDLLCTGHLPQTLTSQNNNYKVSLTRKKYCKEVLIISVKSVSLTASLTFLMIISGKEPVKCNIPFQQKISFQRNRQIVF